MKKVLNALFLLSILAFSTSTEQAPCDIWILGAMFSHVDITEQSKATVQNCSFNIPGNRWGLPDPWPGVLKTAVVFYMRSSDYKVCLAFGTDGQAISPKPTDACRDFTTSPVVFAAYAGKDITDNVRNVLGNGKSYSRGVTNEWGDPLPGWAKTQVILWKDYLQPYKMFVGREGSTISAS
jgi:hypothetical protein